MNNSPGSSSRCSKLTMTLRRSTYYLSANGMQAGTPKLTANHKRIMRVIKVLEKESVRQRQSSLRIPPGRQMSAITPDTAKFFSMLVKAIGSTKILEIGTSSGYSALWFADAVLSTAGKSKRASIVTIEKDPPKIAWAARNFKRAGVDKIITIMEGEAIAILRRIGREGLTFDFVLIDADKENVEKYFDLALPMVRKGGIIATDNMLYPEHFQPLMEKYAVHVRKNPRVQSVTVPIGNGEELSLKLK